MLGEILLAIFFAYYAQKEIRKVLRVRPRMLYFSTFANLFEVRGAAVRWVHSCSHCVCVRFLRGVPPAPQLREATQHPACRPVAPRVCSFARELHCTV